MFLELDSHPRDLGIVGKEVIDQLNAQFLHSFDGMLAGQRINRVLHGIRGEYFGVVALGVRSLEIPSKLIATVNSLMS